MTQMPLRYSARTSEQTDEAERDIISDTRHQGSEGYPLVSSPVRDINGSYILQVPSRNLLDANALQRQKMRLRNLK